MSDDIIFIENYCYPVRNYAARSITIVSHKIGIVELYEETGGFDVRRLTQDTFSEDVNGVLPENIRSMSINDVDQFLEEIYYQYTPACWVARRTSPEAEDKKSCYSIEAEDYSDWLNDSFTYVAVKERWDDLYSSLVEKIR